MKLDINGLAHKTLVANNRLDLVSFKKGDNLVETSPWQGQVTWKVFTAADDARLVECLQSHGLSLVELGILKRCDPEQPVHHLW